MDTRFQTDPLPTTKPAYIHDSTKDKEHNQGMTMLDTSRQCWNQTPKRVITTTVHRMVPVTAQARKHCRGGSRNARKLYRKSRDIRTKIAQVHQNWERHAALEAVGGTGMVGMESLALRNMTASGRGTASAPGSGQKHGLNRSLAESCLGVLGQTIGRPGHLQGWSHVCKSQKRTEARKTKPGALAHSEDNSAGGPAGGEESGKNDDRE